MKLRILGNSLRLRVTRPELERIAAGEEVLETVAFAPDSRLSYSLAAGPVEGLEARYREGSLRVVVPARLVERWAAPEEVSIRGAQPLGDGEELRISVEKDYRCVGPAEEDQSDMFPNPAGGSR